LTAASDGRNRRRFPRVTVRGEVSGRIHTVASAPVVDLSEGGALLEVPCVLRPRSLYTFRLSLGESQVLVLQSSVVRSYVHSVQPVGDGESRVQYRAAIQFINLRDSDRDLLRLRLYGHTEPVTGEENAPLHDHTPEALLGDLLAAATPSGMAPSVLDGLTALLEENGLVGAEPEPSAPASSAEPLPPLPDLASLPPLPDIEPWPSAPAASEPRSKPVPVEQAPPPAEADDEVAEAVREIEPLVAPVTKPPPGPVEPEVAEARPPDVPPAPSASAWQRLRGWMGSKPAAEETRSSSILGLGLEPPPARAGKPQAVGERRDFARVVVEGTVSGGTGPVMRSEVDALSVGGLMARLPFAPENGETLSFTIEIDDRPIVVEGTVRNVQEVRVAGDVEYRVGLEFGPLDEQVRATIEDYVERRIEEEETETPVD
jgi:hypothetical protein